MKYGKAEIMGVLNVTPDSFSDGGEFDKPNKALKQALQLVENGADIIDVGGESTGPGSKDIALEEELKRVIPVVKVIRKHDKKITISIDTWKSDVARHAIKAGANMINDVTALRGDPEMVNVVAETGVPVCLMYSKDLGPRTSKNETRYEDVVGHISRFLQERIEFARKNAVKKSQIIIDPGMGAFVSTDPKYSFEILTRLSEFKKLGYPILVGVSRKSFVGGKLHERDMKSAMLSMIAIKNGANIVRLHDVSKLILC